MFWSKTKRNDVDSFCCDQAGKILTGSQRQTSWAASVLSRLQDSLLDLGACVTSIRGTSPEGKLHI